ncbi:alpha-L-arabinofuranosidase [Colletotrichum truncatum]|uniref:Alpha-L-arabinofuranosidase n=1 Tax=Colletotrichum truncatum TaxID=5467 RepID=A0ACC3ZBC7_COLTU
MGGGLAANISVLSQKGNYTSHTPYGLMFEEINHSADGGIYAELIQNRAFQGSDSAPASLASYSAINGAILSLQNSSNGEPLSDALPNYMRISASLGNGSDTTTAAQIGFSNSGWWGIDVKVQPYQGSFFVRGRYNGTFTASLQSAVTNQTFGSVQIRSQSNDESWTKHAFTLTPTTAAESTNNVISITFDPSLTDGSLDFNLISLFPPTYNNRANGLRSDIMNALVELKPKFLRFPGGGNLNGILKGTQHKWNETIGPLQNRPGRTAVWGYYETQGLGLIEYLQWCDDLDMEPVLVAWSGLNFVDGPLSASDLAVYVQDTLNQLEFITGSSSTKFGALRASLGYPDPWKLKYIQIGNEDNLTGGLPSYEGYRLKMYHDAIKEAYPDLIVMASASELTMNMTSFPGDLAGDQHKYTVPDRFVGSNFGFFDHFTHQTIVSELAVVAPNRPDGSAPSDRAEYTTYPFWLGSVAEAVFLLGAERNGDRVIGVSYAPLLANMNPNASQWTPTQIAYDADPARTTRSTSFHTYKLLASHVLTETLPSEGDIGYGPLYWVTGRNNQTGSLIFKAAVYNSTADVHISLDFDGVPAGATGELTILTSSSADAQNVLGGPEVIHTNVSTVVAGSDANFVFALPNLSVATLIVKEQI